MTLTPIQIKELKNQLRQQIVHLPEDQKAQAEKQIQELSTEALESMVKQQQSQTPQKIFRSIISGQIPSKKIDENLQAMAVIEIMPIAKGHVIIIPKKPIQDKKDIPAKIMNFSKKIERRILTKLKPKYVESIAETKFQEVIINLIPVYNEEVSLDSERKKATENELFEMHTLLKIKPKTKVIRVTKKKASKGIRKIKRRIA